MKKIWLKKTDSFDEAEGFDNNYYLKMNSSKRLQIMQFLREEYFKIRKEIKDESRKGLRRTVRVIK
ncbi:MAG: hypothetical protein AB1393_07560 [Candidatus Edwardsbacteria bacterium]